MKPLSTLTRHFLHGVYALLCEKIPLSTLFANRATVFQQLSDLKYRCYQSNLVHQSHCLRWANVEALVAQCQYVLHWFMAEYWFPLWRVCLLPISQHIDSFIPYQLYVKYDNFLLLVLSTSQQYFGLLLIILSILVAVNMLRQSELET